MPIYVFKCSICGEKFELHISMAEYRDRIPCPDCSGVMRRFFTPVAVICHWGSGVIGGERQGYIPGVDDPQTEIRADMKALEEKRMHTDDPQKRYKLGETENNFAEAHGDILR